MMDTDTKARIADTQRRNWEERRAQREHLQALEASHRRVLELMDMCTVLVERLANEGDSLAKYVIDELEKARTSMKSENVAASAFLAEASSG